MTAAEPAGVLSGVPAARGRRPNRGFLAKLVANLRRANQRRAERDIAEIVASRGGAMRDRCQRGSCQRARRSFPFRQLPALRPR